MEQNNVFYCYSLRLFHFLSAFNQKCLASKINQASKKRYWVFNKSEQLDKIIELYNKTKYEFS